MKRKKNPPRTTSNPKPSSSSVQNVIDSDGIDNPRNQTQSKRSWVWNHLKKSTESGFVVCQIITKAGKICGEKLKKDKSGSTKSFHGHLQQIHHLADLHLTKKTDQAHRPCKVEQNVELQVTFFFG